MKQNLSIWICLLAALLLGACGARSAGEKATPGAASAQPEPEEGFSLIISEAMADNKATLSDEQGEFPDWVELYNAGEEALPLAGFTLGDGANAQTLAGEIAPGSYALFFCRDFGLSSDGETVTLSSPRGTVLDTLALPAAEADCSVTHEGISRWPTPGHENTRAGWAAFQAGRAAGELAISEAAVYDPAGDWVELVNRSDKELELSGFCLSDKNGERLRCPLPEETLGPGEYTVLLCEELGLGLDAARDELYLSRADGTLLDYVSLHDIPLGGTVGREEGEGGFFWYAVPSPWAANSGGCRDVAPAPVLLGEDGVFDGVESVTAELAGVGEIRYTTDGSVPTAESTLYSEPLTVTQTGVIRAACFQEGGLPSEPLTLSYILNENHTLPVVSVCCEPELVFGRGGIYTNPTEHWEMPGAVMFYDGEEGFRLDCGVKLHGATSRIEQEKKSFKLCFRSRYDGQLHYDLFDNGVTDFASILLRADQEEHETSYLRDNIMHQLARDAFPELPRQDYRPAVLYLNGQYWGLYNIREAHSATHFAQHRGLDPDRVIQWQGAWDQKGAFAEIYHYVLHHEMRDADSYAYVTAHLDVDSVIDWCIMQVYSGNFDFNSPNMRFYWDEESERLSYALVDLDLGMFTYGDFQHLFGFGYAYTELAARLSQNPDFRARLCTRMGEALAGPLSDEAIHAKIDFLADQLRPEVARDRARWGEGSIDSWEHMVQRLHDWVSQSGSLASYMVWDLDQWYRLTSEEEAQYFPGLR